MSDRYWDAWDGPLHYIARMDRTGVWRLKINSSPIGYREGFPSLEAAQNYILGYDRQTGEVID